MSLADLEKRLAALESKTTQIMRLGKVVSVNQQRATVRVRLGDADGLVTNDLPVLTRRAARDKDYWLPDMDDQAVCLFRGTGLEDGVCLGVLFSEPSPVPLAAQDKRHVRFSDGTWLEYDRARHILTGSVRGRAVLDVDESAEIVAGGAVTAQAGTTLDVVAGVAISLTAPVIALNGNLSAVSNGNANMVAGGKFSINAAEVSLNDECE